MKGQLHKIAAYFDLLEELGTRVGEPVTKHIDGEIRELRPLDNRILYTYYKDKLKGMVDMAPHGKT